MKFIFIFIFSLPIFASPLYVTSPVAKMLKEPSASADGPLLQKGTVVDKIGEKDMFIKIVFEGKEGYVNKLFVSDKPASGKVSFGDSIDQSTSVKARARASSFTQTAAARGFSESQTLRTRGGANDYDMDSIVWLQNIQISENEINNFK
jgi:hypothetical protein